MSSVGGFASLHEAANENDNDGGEELDEDVDDEEDDIDDRNLDSSCGGSADVVGAATTEHHVIRHIDRNILCCQICRGRYREPKVGQQICV